MDTAQLKLVTDFINLPTAPFREQAPLGFIREFVAARPALRAKPDRFGNLLIEYKLGPSRPGARPVLFAAHLDHPGFTAAAMQSANSVRASWNGWVRPEFFKGAGVRFWQGHEWVRGEVVDIVPGKPEGGLLARNRKPAAGASAKSFGAESPPSAAIISVPTAIDAGAVGMWDIPDARIENNRIITRACDDVVGAAAILCMLDALCRRKAKTHCLAFFTRAEEVGFGGALAAVAERTIPRKAIVVAIECSKAIAGVSLGAGPVLRVGDKASVFTPAATAFCQVVAEQLQTKNKEFKFQRKLMDGGTCESTVYCHYGYDATGICLPLLNYHNMDLDAGKIAPEMVDVSDLEHMISWFIALATTTVKYDGAHPGLGKRLDSLLGKHRPALLRQPIHHA